MIFLTVGAQMPFDRLVRLVDCWASSRSDVEVVAQIGKSSYRPEGFRRTFRLMSPTHYRVCVERSSLLVSHAGMGTILTAERHHKPLIIFPRQGALRETRNDHQGTTAEKLRGRGWLHVAMNAEELLSHLDGASHLQSHPPHESSRCDGLVGFLSEYLTCQ